MLNTSRERSLAASVLGLGLLFLGNWGFIAVRAKLAEIRLDIDTKQSLIETYKEDYQKREEKLSIYKDIIAEVNLTGDKPSTVRGEITRILEDSGLGESHRSMKPKARSSSKDARFEGITFTIADIECTLEQLFDLLHRIDAYSSVMEVGKIKINPVNQTQYHYNLKVTLDITRLCKAEEKLDSKRKKRGKRS
jgi:hypothetical protein